MAYSPQPRFPPSAWAQGIDYAKIEILTEKIAPNLYMLSGSAGADPGHEDAAGGRIGVLAGPDGIFMVDAQYAQLTDKVVAAIRKISSEPIRFLVNTHVHGDHTAGNANFVKMGALLFAREELREELMRPPAVGELAIRLPRGSGAAPGGDLRHGRSGEASPERRNRRPDSGAGGPYRRRYDDPV